MNTSDKGWKPITTAFTNEINDALQQQHHAAQFIALVGHYLIPQQSDDSNTNMKYLSDGNMLVGHPLPNGLSLALHLEDLRISILDKESNPKKVIALQGKTQQEVFDELKHNLADLAVDVSGFKNKLHYIIPGHPLDKGAVFSATNEFNFIENANYRYNASIVLNKIAQLFEQNDAIRIWPHHFDTGAFFVVSKNEKGEATKTIGIGLAFPDSMVNEPYYYLSFWFEKPLECVENLQPVNAGKWMIPNWNGAILKYSEILKAGTASKQHEMVKTFFNSGIEILMNLFKAKD